MSGPSDLYDPRDPLYYAPKWAHAAAFSQRHAAARPAHDPDLFDESSDGARASTGVDDAEAVEPVQAPPSLEPTVLQAPLPDHGDQLHYQLWGGLALAAIASAIFTAIVVGQVPALNSSADDDSADVSSFKARFAAHETHQADPVSPPAAWQFPVAPTSALAAGNNAVRDNAARDQSPRAMDTKGITTRTITPSPAVRKLDPDDIAVLVKRGQELVAAGDIAGARIVLLRAAKARNAEAALILAATYDPGALEKVAIYGVVADITMARSWYEKAKEFGSAEAPRRLELLAGRMR